MRGCICICVFLAVLVFQTSSLFSRDLTTIKRSGKIYVGMTKDDLGSINYDLAVEFAKYLNVEFVQVTITWDEAFMKNGLVPKDLETNPSIIYNPDVFKKVDIICSTFTVLEWRRKIFDFAETMNSAELLLIDKKSPPVKSFSELSGKSIAFMKGTSFEAHMNEINKGLGKKINLVPLGTSEETEEQLRQRKVFGIILDADEALNLNVTSGMKYSIAMPITQMTKTAWVVEKGNNLKNEVEEFFKTIESNEELDKLFKKRFNISYPDYVRDINKIILLEKHNHDLGSILEEGKLVVGLSEKSFVYKREGEKQFMHALAEEFADYLGISLEYLVTPNYDKYWETEGGKIIRDSIYSPDWFGYIDLACDMFTPEEWQMKKVNFVPVLPSEYTVIARKDEKIKSTGDLKGLKCVIAKGLVSEDILLENKISGYVYEQDSSLLTDIISGKADYTILNDARFNLQDFPELESKISLGKINICWGLRKDQPRLTAELKKFLEKSKKSGLIRSLLDNPLQSPETVIHNYYERFQVGQFPSVQYGAGDGLPQEDIFAIFQDKKGYMWFGTCSGAVRYNGREMKSIGNSLEEADNSIRDINQDSAGLIYLASSKGITVIDKDTVVDQLFIDQGFHSVFIDRSDNKWFIGDDTIFILNKDGSTRNLNKEFPRLKGIINNIDEDKKSGDKYIATSEGIYCYSPGSNQLLQKTENECYYLFIDVHNHLWLSAEEGLIIGSLKDFKSANFALKSKNLNASLSLDNDIITNIRSDKNGAVWLIFDTKIIQMTSNDNWATIYDHEIGVRNNKILSSLFDREDNLWIGFFGGLQRLAYRHGLRNFFPREIDSYIYTFKQTNDGRLWIASNNGVLYYDGKLVNFSDRLDSHHKEIVGHNEKYVLGTLPTGNLLFVCNEGMYEVNPGTQSVVRKKMFDQAILSPENIFISSKGEIILLTGIDGVVYYLAGFESVPVIINDENTDNISQMIETDGHIFGGNADGIVELKGGHITSVAATGCKVWSLLMKDSIMWAGTDWGLIKIFRNDFNNMESISIGDNTVVKSILPAINKNYLWLGTNRGFAYFNTSTERAEFFMDSKDGLSGDEVTPSGLFLDRNNLLWIGTYHGVSNFNNRAMAAISYPLSCYIEKILMNGQEIDMKQNRSFRYNQNNFVFEISAISFTDEKAIEYEFYIRGTGNNYSSYNKGKEYKAYYNNLPPGKYEFIYKAKGKNNIQSYSQKYVFTIRPAWFNTWIFRVTLFVIIIVIIYLIYKARVQTIEAQKKKLEQQVKERTMEIQIANLEIQGQRDMARSQRDRIAEQKKEITDSIYYAERIQRSLLPPVITLKAMLPEHFVLFKPKNIVSGDFYWSFEKGDKIFIAAVDCTGHGVPGALMSMLGISFLNEIVITSDETGPEKILNHLREYIIKTLKQVGHEGESRDGMDISMLVFDKARTTISFSGANSPLYFVRNGELQEIKGDKMPVGIYERMNPFVQHTLNIQKGDTFYIFSDGYADQFGGPKSKKFMYSNFKKLLLELQPKPMIEQGVFLDETLKRWQGDLEQIDDIVVIGLRF